MKRAKRLEPVQNLVDDAQRRLAQSVSTLERRVLDGEAKLNELQRYKAEYEQQFSQRAGRGIMTPEELLRGFAIAKGAILE